MQGLRGDHGLVVPPAAGRWVQPSPLDAPILEEGSIMAQNLEFNNLMLLYTVPLYWEPRPLFHAQQLREFLLHLLDPRKPGFAALGIPGKGQPSYTWLYGDQAVTSVQQIYKEVWLQGSQLLQQFGKAVNEQVFHQFIDCKLQVFLTGEKLWACMEAIPHAAKALTQALEAIKNLYFGFLIDWSFLGNTLLWTPQLRISNFIPSNRRMAPPPPNGDRPPSPMSCEDAAACLEDCFWKQAETIFRMLRHAFHLGEAGVWIEDREVRPPVFYYAEPTQMPTEPDDFLTSPSYRSALDHLGRVCLGAQDLSGTDVAGALLEGNLVTFRREIVRHHEAVRAFYLVLPWWSGDRSSWIEEVERELAFVADKWFFVEFAAGYRAYDIYTDLAIPMESMALWSGISDTAARLTSELHNLIAYEATGSPRREQVFSLVNHLRAMLARLEAEMLRVTDDVMVTRRKWKGALESMTLYARQVFTSRPLAGIRPLLGTLSDFFPCRYSEELTDRATARAEQLRKTYDAVERAIQDLTEQEQREERKREEQFREEQREREERRQRTLNYGLAALAAITAFPILIGQMDWTELKEVISHWPGVFRGLGSILEAVHPYLVLIATISAGSVIAFLLTMVVWTALRARGTRKGVVESTGVEKWREIGSKITQVWQLVGRSRRDIGTLRESAFGSMRVPGGKEDEKVRGLREQVDKWDRIAYCNLVEAWEWLRSLSEKIYENPPKEELDYLRLRVWQFIISTELLGNRPAPFPFPVALCLFRYKSTDFVKSTVVSDYEFQQVLKGYGFTDDEVKAIDRWADLPLSQVKGYTNHELARQGKRLRDLPAGEFVKVLREVVGVSALHEREIQPPAGR